MVHFRVFRVKKVGWKIFYLIFPVGATEIKRAVSKGYIAFDARAFRAFSVPKGSTTMKHTKRSLLPVAAVLTTAFVPLATAYAQTPPAAPANTAVQAPAVAAQVPTKPVPAFKIDHTLAREVAAQLTKTTGATVVTDSTTGLLPVTMSTVGGPLPTILDQVVKTLPKGVVVRVVMLPALAGKTLMPSGDDIAALYLSQEHIVVPVMGGKVERTEKSINVLGKILDEDKALPIIAALDLRPVYLITNPDAGDNPVSKSAQLQAEGMRLWQSMTPEQRAQSAERQFDALLNMDSPTRQAMFSQFAQVGQTIAQKMQTMPAEQRQQFISDVTGGMKLPTPPPAPPKSGGN